MTHVSLDYSEAEVVCGKDGKESCKYLDYHSFAKGLIVR